VARPPPRRRPGHAQPQLLPRRGGARDGFPVRVALDEAEPPGHRRDRHRRLDATIRAWCSRRSRHPAARPPSRRSTRSAAVTPRSSPRSPTPAARRRCCSPTTSTRTTSACCARPPRRGAPPRSAPGHAPGRPGHHVSQERPAAFPRHPLGDPGGNPLQSPVTPPGKPGRTPQDTHRGLRRMGSPRPRNCLACRSSVSGGIVVDSAPCGGSGAR